MDVVVVGSCNVDLISYIDHLPQKGETIHGSKFKMGFGGKGANQCVTAAKLGAKTAMVAKVGVDPYGTGFVEEFNRLQVNTDYILNTEKASTGVAPCLVGQNGESAIVIVSGANLLLTPQDVDAAERLIQSAKVMVCQLEITAASTMEALRLAKKHGVTTIFNPAPKADDLDEEIYSLCDVFCPNETEVADSPVTSVEEAGEAAVSYLDKGCKIVIVTLGEKGCVYATQDDRTVRRVPCEQVEAIDTTGAGDCFVGSLAYFMAREKDLPLDEMIKRASYVATVSVRREGTQSSYPTLEELPAWVFSSD
ncbi:ribokinase-like [Watersipora subatra]|uniref:ribokinase-like n=1 Tax=Watersipora subatra TaxID=2589382 RepID=UPI00355B8EC2